MTAADEAKQLDSVTDVVKEAEIDESKAQQAMSALSSSKQGEDSNAAALASISVSKEDVAIIVNHLEVTEDVAKKALREAAVANQGKILETAIRKLVTS